MVEVDVSESEENWCFGRKRLDGTLWTKTIYHAACQIVDVESSV